MAIIPENKRVLFIPDIHLKPWILDRAEAVMKSGAADLAVNLGDTPDDFNQQRNLTLYDETFNRAIEFDNSFPDTLWCIGNHDFSYLYNYDESGFSDYAKVLVKLHLVSMMKRAGNRMAYMHRVGRCVFSHAGLSEEFAAEYFSQDELGCMDKAIERINRMKPQAMWDGRSPIWLRPTYSRCKMFMADRYLQVTVHTPVRHPVEGHGFLILDTFSTNRDGSKYGEERLVIVDTETMRWEYAEA